MNSGPIIGKWIDRMNYEAALHEATVLRSGVHKNKVQVRSIGAVGRGLCIATIDETKSGDIELKLPLRSVSNTVSLFS
jgi:hypothetical protein